MRGTIETFMKIGLTVAVIAGLLYVIGVNMIKSETNDYKAKVEGVQPPAANASTGDITITTGN